MELIRTIVDARRLLLGLKDPEASLDITVIATSGLGEVDASPHDVELGLGSDVQVRVRAEIACRLVVCLLRVVGDSAVKLTHDALPQGSEFHGAGAVVVASDEPRSLLVNKAVVDDVRDGSLAQLTGGQKRAIPALLRLGEVALAIVVVGEPNVGQVTVNGSSALLGCLRRSRDQLASSGVRLTSPIQDTSHRRLKLDGAVLRQGHIAVDPEHVVVR